MEGYVEVRDGFRYTRLQEAGFVLVGFLFGWIGVMVDWAIAHRKGQMECSAEGIYLGIIGWATSVVCWFALMAAGVIAPAASLVALVVCGASAWLLGLAGIALAVPDTLLGTAPIDGRAIFLLVVAILFILLSDMWVYGMRYKQTPAEKALGLWFKRFCWTWNWQVVPVPGRESDQCRLIWRCDCTFERYHRANKYFVVFILGTASIVMGRRYMDVMKKLAEGRMTYPDSKR